MKIMNKSYLITSIITVGIGIIATWFYRPYIYSHHIFDYWLADSIGSLVCVPGYCFFIWSFKPYSTKEKNRMIIFVSVFFSFIWEGMTAVFSHHLDWRDMIAVWIGAMIAYLIREKIDAKEKRFF